MIPMKILGIFFLGFTLLGPRFSLGFGNGAPSKVCDTMKPSHGSAERRLSPYTINVSESSFSPNGSLTITIVGDVYRGLMLQARHPEKINPVGIFSDFPYGTKPMKCSVNYDTVTHSSAGGKNNLAVYTWTAPSDIKQDIYFVATLAVHKYMWWVNVQSALITLKLPTTTTSTTTTTTTATTTRSTTHSTSTTATTTTTTKPPIVTSAKPRATHVTQLLEIIMNDEVNTNQTIITNDVDVLGEWDSEPIDFATRGAPSSPTTTANPTRDESTTKKTARVSVSKSSNYSSFNKGADLALLLAVIWTLQAI